MHSSIASMFTSRLESLVSSSESPGLLSRPSSHSISPEIPEQAEESAERSSGESGA